jgi:hypothetical protein
MRLGRNVISAPDLESSAFTRKRRIDSMPENIKVIPLTKGLYAVVDATDFDRVSQYRWYAQTRNHTNYAACDLQNPKRHMYMHRFLLGEPQGLDVDHINHDGLDNRRSNLRSATRSQNHFNKRKSEGKSSKFKGVSRYKNGKWQAHIGINGKRHSLGNSFKTEEEAFEAYCAEAKRMHGDYLHLDPCGGTGVIDIPQRKTA